MYEIKTDKFKSDRKVLIDGMEISFVAPGAGSQLTFSQNERRLKFLEKKLEAGTADLDQMQKDIEQMEQLEDKMLGFFASVMRDGTDDNHKVKAWLQETPLGIIQAAFTEMQEQFKQTDTMKEGDAGQTETTAADA